MELSEIKINIDFENLIPKQTAEQFKQLEENMVAEGRARNPLVLWRNHGVLVDGHHRMKILKAHPEIKWSVVEQDFADEEEAKEWIIKNALGTRNLTEPDYAMLMATLYKLRKKKAGGQKGNKNAEKQCTQNGDIVSKTPTRVSEQLAEELGVSKNTILRAERFADGLEAADKVVPGFKAGVLSGKVKAQKQEIREMRKQTPEEIKESVEYIVERKTKRNASDFELMRKIKENSAIASGVSIPKYGLAELIREIDALGDSFMLSLSSVIKRRKDIITAQDGNAEEIASRFDNIIERIREMKGEL